MGRDPRVELILAAAQVQGIGAVESMINALDGLAQIRDLDVVILARGGGAAEELWPFNDEALVRALSRFGRPVCVGVGHESDITLADLVADVRAATPSAARARTRKGPSPSIASTVVSSSTSAPWRAECRSRMASKSERSTW